MHQYVPWHFEGETLEIIVVGGAMLGVGIGMIIRYGGVLMERRLWHYPQSQNRIHSGTSCPFLQLLRLWSRRNRL